MSLAAAVQTVPRHLRDKELVIALTPTSNYQGPTTAIAANAFTQPGGAGTPLKSPALISTAALSGSVTFSTSLGGGATQAANMATYTNLTSAVPATATAAAVALAAALTAGALGIASGATYTGSISGGVLSIATNQGTEVLSVTVSSLVETIAGGDTVDLTKLTNPNNIGDAAIGFPGTIKIWEVIGTPAGYNAKLVPGAALNTWRLRVFSAMGTELATGAYPAAILADVFTIRLVGPKGRL